MTETCEYTHVAESNEALVQKILARGLDADAARLGEILEAVGYYRLKGYLVPFYEYGTEQFRKGAKLDEVWSIYTYDRHLKAMAFDAISRIEIAVRAAIIRALSRLDANPLAYTKPEFMNRVDAEGHAELLHNIERAVNQARNEPCIAHMRIKYGMDKYPPIWAMMEVLSIGTLINFFAAMPLEAQQEVANHFSVRPSVFREWLSTLRKVRNCCAHQSRLWNRKIRNAPTLKIGSKDDLKALEECIRCQSVFTTSTIFTVLSICQHLLHIARPQGQWKARCKKLLHEATPFVLRGMGVPENWEELELWKD